MKLHNDCLVYERKRKDGSIYRTGKRVSKDCLLTAEERKVYVNHGLIQATKYLMHTRQISIRASVNLLNQARSTTILKEG